MKKQTKVDNIRPKAGQWFKLHTRDFLSCCDCGLTHRIELKVAMKGNKPEYILMRMWRNKKMRTKTFTP